MGTRRVLDDAQGAASQPAETTKPTATTTTFIENENIPNSNDNEHTISDHQPHHTSTNTIIDHAGIDMTNFNDTFDLATDHDNNENNYTPDMNEITNEAMNNETRNDLNHDIDDNNNLNIDYDEAVDQLRVDVQSANDAIPDKPLEGEDASHVQNESQVQGAQQPVQGAQQSNLNESQVQGAQQPSLRRSNRVNKGTKNVLNVTHEAKKRYEVTRHKFFLQRARKHNKPKLHLQFLMRQRKQMDDTERSMMDVAVNFLFAQKKFVRDKDGNELLNNKEMPASKGFKVFGEEAVAAMLKEFKQLHFGAMEGKPVVAPVKYEDLSENAKKKVMEAVNLVKKKRNGIMKARSCLNGSTQKKFLKELESFASPTVCLESILMTLGIDIYEERDVAIFDVPGAYLHAIMPEDREIVMVLRGKFVDIMCEVDPSYNEYVKYVKGKKVLYLRVLRALYGCIESALLWYELYANTLEGLGFKINPYDRCVANKLINGEQCTICWYVDDNKVSHKDKNVVSDVIKTIEGHFGKLKVSRGDQHDFLGMNIDLDRKNKKVNIGTSIHIKEAVEMFEESGDEIKGHVANPGNSQFFKYKDAYKSLDQKRADIFHSTVAKLLFIGKRGRPDLEPYIAYLCTRVSKSNEYDWRKLKRVLQFANQTIDDKRCIGAKTLTDLYTWIDAAYAVHPDMRSQTGGVMSLGHGMIHCKSSKQKLNTKSSTEAELVGISDYLPYNLWAKMFMEEQGYELKMNTIFQDNQSTIKMGTNGRTSCTGNSRHIDVRYFFVADRVKKKEVQIKYCPTQLMIADYFTKPLHGKLFHTLRDLVMGTTSIFEMMNEYFPPQERIGNDDILKTKERKEENEKVREEKMKGECAEYGTERRNTFGTDSERKIIDKTPTVTWADIVRKEK